MRMIAVLAVLSVALMRWEAASSISIKLLSLNRFRL